MGAKMHYIETIVNSEVIIIEERFVPTVEGNRLIVLFYCIALPFAPGYYPN